MPSAAADAFLAVAGSNPAAAVGEDVVAAYGIPEIQSSIVTFAPTPGGAETHLNSAARWGAPTLALVAAMWAFVGVP